MATTVIDSLSFGSDKYVFTVPYGSCSTAADTAAKVLTVENFVLENGAAVAVKFTVTNTAANPTLNVNSTGAKAIYYNGAAISAGYLKANKVYLFIYNGTQFDFVGDVDTNSDTKNTAGSSDTSSKIFLIGATSQAANPVTYSHDTVYVDTDGCLYSNNTKVSTEGHTHNYLPLSGGTLTGNLTGEYLTGTWLQTTAANNLNATPPYIAVIDNSGWIYKRTPAELYADIAQDSGVTAGSYGPTANASPAYGGTFTVPQVTVDAKGRVTGAASRTITMPTVSHPTISKSSDTTSTASPGSAGTFTAVDSVTRDSNGHVTKVNTKTVTMPTSPTLSSLGGASTKLYTATIGTSWNGSAAPYTQAITVSGILASDTPIVDVNLSSIAYANKNAVMEAYGKVYRITTAANSITVYADEKTTTSIPIQLKVIR